jgi:hypothetical protein
MSRVAPEADEPTRRRAARGTVILGLLLLVPRLVLAWFAGPILDLLQVAAVLVFVGGLLVIAFGIFRYRMLRNGRIWPIAVIGAACVLLAGILVTTFPPGKAQIAFEGGVLVPPSVIAYQYLYFALGAMSQLGLMLLVGSIGSAVVAYRSRRA